MANEITVISVSDIEKMAMAVAKSNLFGVKTIEQAMALMLVAQAEGLHPAIAARDYHIIQGKPALKADAMFARFQTAGGNVKWKDYTDDKVTGVFTHPQGGTVEITWTIEMAKKANLTGKDTWRQYPRQMLRARVISDGIRTVYPGVAVGVYTPEEVQDFVEPMKDVTPVDDGFGPKVFKNSALRNEFCKNVKSSFEEATSLGDLEERKNHYKAKLDAMKVGSEYDVMGYDELEANYKNIYRGLKAIKQADNGNFEAPDEEDDLADIPAHMQASHERNS